MTGIPPANTLVRSYGQPDFANPQPPDVESPSPTEEQDVELTVITSYAYDIPRQKDRKRCDDKIKCLCKCTIL